MVPTCVPLVLASASPARLSTLQRAGVRPYVLVSRVDENAVVSQAASQYGELAAQDVALLLARAKCEAVTRLLASDDTCPQDAPLGALVLGCDSVLEHDGEVHGKPADQAEASSRWKRMRGTSGVLHTAHWLIDDRHDSDGGTGATMGAVASTTVHFAKVSDDEIAAYVASGEPLQVAGGFTIDGLGGPFVSGIEGDHHNVVGISLPLLREMLSEINVSWSALTHDQPQAAHLVGPSTIG
jgi:septum formation protein